MRITAAAKLLGVSSESIRTGAVGNFQTFKLKDARTSPVYCWAAEVKAYMQALEKH